MPGIIRIPGLPVLTYDRCGVPATIRWVSIDPTGAVEVHAVDNRRAFSAQFDMWLQWLLIRDVHRVIDPADFGPRHDGLVATITETDDDLVILEPHRGGKDLAAWPENPVASAMCGTTHILRGTVAVLGEMDPDTGLHADLTADRLDELRDLAGQACARRDSGQRQPSSIRNQKEFEPPPAGTLAGP